jgi:hypothetical protein
VNFMTHIHYCEFLPFRICNCNILLHLPLLYYATCDMSFIIFSLLFSLHKKGSW